MDLYEVYDYAYAYKKTKLWTKLRANEFFAVKLSGGEMGVCSVTGVGNEVEALTLHVGKSYEALYRMEKFPVEEMPHHKVWEESIKQDGIICYFIGKDSLLEEDYKKIAAYRKDRGVRVAGKNAFACLARIKPYREPAELVDEREITFIGEALKAAVEIAKRIDDVGKAATGFDKLFDEIPLLTEGENGYTCTKYKLPEVGDEVFPEPRFRNDILRAKLGKLKKKGTLECEVLCLPIPGVVEKNDTALYPFTLLSLIVEEQDCLAPTIIKSYEKEAGSLVGLMAKELSEKRLCPQAIKVHDRRTECLLRNFCSKLGIIIMSTGESETFKEARESFFDTAFAAIADGEDVEAARALLDVIETLSIEQLAGLPDELVQDLYGIYKENILPPDLQKKLKRLFD